MPAQPNQAVLAYYQHTWLDYRYLWTGRHDLAIHFGYYDQVSMSHAQALLEMNHVLAAYGQISASDRVLDAGCGIGGMALWLAQHVACLVAGITIVPAQAHVAAHYAQQRQLANQVQFACADYTHMPFPDGYFDVVLAHESFVHAACKADAVLEATRVLCSGGRLVLAEYMLRDTPPLSAAECQLLDPWLSGWAMPNLHSPVHYEAQLAQLGFENLQCFDITQQVEPSLQRLARMARLVLPVVRMLTALKLFHPVRLGNVLGSVVQYQALQAQLWRYIIITAQKS